jgi:hypothetical protein
VSAQNRAEEGRILGEEGEGKIKARATRAVFCCLISWLCVPRALLVWHALLKLPSIVNRLPVARARTTEVLPGEVTPEKRLGSTRSAFAAWRFRS